jgi:hypothetical protein
MFHSLIAFIITEELATFEIIRLLFYSIIDVKGCVRMKRGGKTWQDSDCSTRYAFICMKGGNLINFVEFKKLICNYFDKK